MADTLVVLHLSDIKRAKELAAAIEGSPAIGSVSLAPRLASSTDELYQIIRSRDVEFLVIENELRSFLDGLEIVERLHVDTFRPNTVLLAQSTDEVRLRAMQLGIATILPSDSAVERIQRAVVELARKKKGIAVPEAVHHVLRGIGTIQAAPRLLLALAEHLESQSEPYEHELLELIASDPKSSSELLTATRRVQQQVLEVSDAIQLIGVRHAIWFAIARSFFEIHSSLDNREGAEQLPWSSRRSLLIGVTASMFADHSEGISPYTAFMLGMAQDIGIALMIGTAGKRYQEITRRFQKNARLKLHVIEQTTFDFTHADMSTAFLQSWGFPEAVLSLVHMHLDSYYELDEVSAAFARVMLLGEALADLTNGHYVERYTSFARLLRGVRNVDPSECTILIRKSISEYAEMSRLLDIAVPETGLNDLVAEKMASEMASVKRPAAVQPPSVQPVEVEIVQSPTSAPAKNVVGSILLVEDEAFVVELITRMLANVGLQVIACETAEDAKEYANQVMAALVDVHLRGESGIAIIRDLRSHGFDRPIIVTSGDRTRATIEQGIGAGLTDYLIKPFDEEALLGKLRKHTGLFLEVQSV